MRKLFILSLALFLTATVTAQVTMPVDLKFYKHRYYKLMDDDTLQISLIKNEDRKLLPPLDSLLKPYLADYQKHVDTARVEVTARRVEYHLDEHRAFVFFAPIVVNEFQFVNGEVLTVKQGRDTVSITGKLSNGRPYRVRFMIMYMKSMAKYRDNVDAFVTQKPRKPEAKKEEGTQ